MANWIANAVPNRSPDRNVVYPIIVVACASVAGILASVFHLGWYLPVEVGVALLLGLGILGLVMVRVTPLSLYPRLMVLAYVLPFSSLAGYFFDSQYIWMFASRGMQIISDRTIVAQMVHVGLIGLLALISGLFAVTPALKPIVRPVAPSATLDPILFTVGLVAATWFSWIASPTGTIFDTSGVGSTLADSINFGAAYMVSYLIFTLLFLDVERQAGAERRLAKGIVLAAAVAYVVIVLQLLRGDRESSGLLAALAVLYVTSPAGLAHREMLSVVGRRRMMKLVGPVLIMLTVFIGLGAVRYNANALMRSLSPGQIMRLGVSQSTWTAVLWTNLSAAWEYRVGALEYRYGATYVDYVLALPPGPVARAVGISRVIERGTSLASEDLAGVSTGGLHAVVTPFKNFGAFGVFGILFVWGFLIASIERWSVTRGFGGRWLWAASVCAGLMWFWYGDLPFIRALMIAGLLYLTYRIGIGLRIRIPRLSAPTVPLSS